MDRPAESGFITRGRRSLADVAVVVESTGATAPRAVARPAPNRLPSLAELPKLLAGAPHRLMFFAGATAVLASMLW
ncbi:MAG TPA: hypothetical protein VFL07_09200, partial [Rudaea sp.]|nr:hypothetical protein [Rudaea sp.]